MRRVDPVLARLKRHLLIDTEIAEKPGNCRNLVYNAIIKKILII